MDLSDELMSRDELRSKFGILNYVVFIIMLLVSAMIGRGEKSIHFYFRDQNVIMVELFYCFQFSAKGEGNCKF